MKLFLAPMHGFTVNAFRMLCTDFGASMTFTPLLNEHSVVNNPKLVDVIGGERVGVQLIGSHSRILSKAARIVEPVAELIDLNFGCPAVKEQECGVGAVLLKHPKKVGALVKSVVKSVSKPVTVKVRLGFDKINIFDVLKEVEAAGASAITVHARLGVEDYSVPANWDYIKRVKDESSIPVIGNGDVTSPVEAERMQYETNCDAVMIGRAAIGNPFIFKGVIPSDRDKLGAFLKFYDYYQTYAVNKSLHDLKLQACYFMNELPNARRLRASILKVKSYGELINLLNGLDLQ